MFARNFFVFPTCHDKQYACATIYYHNSNDKDDDDDYNDNNVAYDCDVDIVCFGIFSDSKIDFCMITIVEMYFTMPKTNRYVRLQSEI